MATKNVYDCNIIRKLIILNIIRKLVIIIFIFDTR